MQTSDAEKQVRRWLEQVVIGLNLCPFAGTPWRSGRVRISVTAASNRDALLEDLQRELVLLDGTPATQLETSLLVVTGMLENFAVYNQFLDEADTLLRTCGWEGQYQVASFHPLYRFSGTKEDDVSNLTNRSPWPILHIIREASIDAALATCADPEEIPAMNIRTMLSMSLEARRKYFPWLD
jgi:hypothetical protein